MATRLENGLYPDDLPHGEIVLKRAKVMTLREAVRRFVFDGAVVGVGGQNVSRCAVAAAHEIIRQRRKNLTLVGCNLSIHADMLVGAGSVCRCICGSVNVERFGVAFRCREAIETGSLVIEDHDHLTMISRFLAGEMGLPFIPLNSFVGSDMANECAGAYRLVLDPWRYGIEVPVIRALNPDVSIVHVQRTDELGNLLVEGVLHHEPEMIRASKATIVTCEELVDSDTLRREALNASIPYHFIDAVVEQPLGAYPTGTHGYYNYDGDHIRVYQAYARAGGRSYEEYLATYVYGSATFDEFLDKAADKDRFARLRDEMRRMQK